MRIDLERSFSIARDGAEDTEDLLRYFRKGKGEFSWSNLHDKPLVVVIGEAGIGKTVEFDNEVARLQREGKPAFFVSLNQVLDKDAWAVAVEDSASNYAEWEKSSDVGYFFLDAVDEARLRRHADFQNALSVIRVNLRNHMARVRVAISSRVTDWAVEDVRDAVRKYLVFPIEAALRAAAAVEASTGVDSRAGDVVQMPQETATERVDPFVVSLDALSRTEAERLAGAFQVVDAQEFWAAVDDGNYEFMATRPLDLEWMVRLWNGKHSLGTYSQLVEGNISNRLTEVNPSYQAAGAALSMDQLRTGAEQLAAATEFSGRPFVSTSTTGGAGENEVAPNVVLSEWKPIEVSRLLASAIFDEATFGRVKFHHRSIREYLAARWVNRQLGQGVPFHRVLQLFRASPFGIPVLIPTRRATLCWLSALNVEAREWVTCHFPEMLLFEGDPEAWDTIAADRAFLAYVGRLKAGLRTDWYNDPSEFRRVARRLPLRRVASLLAAQPACSNLTISLLLLVEYGRLMDCADAVFGIYRNLDSSPRERQYALVTLAAGASAEHRAAVRDDLLAGRLASNELIASALGVIEVGALRAEDLVNVFLAAGAESGYGSGPMARAIKQDLLPEADVKTAQLVLAAAVAALPAPEQGRRFARFPESDQPERAWLLDVLPDCLERVLILLPKELDGFPEICIDAAERVEAIRDSGFADTDQLGKLHALIADRPALRWQLALEIAQSDDIRHATSRLTWGGSCLVSFDAADLPALTARANDEALTKDVRDIWFDVGMNLAFRGLKGRHRSEVLEELVSGPDGQSRSAEISMEMTKYISHAKELCQFRREDRHRKLERLARHERDREHLTRDIEHIRDGTDTEMLRWLILYSFKHAGRKSHTHVDFEVIAKDFGQSISDALRSGLVIAWSKVGTPNPADYGNGTVPWETITGLAGLHTLLASGVDIASLSDDAATRAAKLAVWELNGPPSWFERLALTHERAVCAALLPWVEAEAVEASDAGRVRRALELSLQCPSAVRRQLLQSLVPLVHDGRIVNPATLKSILDALREDGLISSDVVAGICHGKVTGSLTADGLISEIRWLRTWLEDDPVSAWTWFESHVARLGTAADTQVQDFATAVADGEWVKTPTSEASIDVLLRMHALLAQHMPPPGAASPSEESGIFGHPVAQLRQAIPQILARTRGRAANRALVALAATESDVHAKRWLNTLVVKHAAEEAQHSAQFNSAALKAIGSPFLTDPQSESQLFQQVLARLEEIREGVEEGPFSDRDLFWKGMPEKYLQRWLAARLQDTQHRRFSIHREEEVDADNKTDIQLSCQYGNVCVEIKPVDAGRTHSANTLVETLRTQIVGQYLKGYNSAHGILVLFRLDDKTWDIPGGAKGRPFTELVAYVQEQAEIIKGQSKGVQELIVFAIDCLG